jgi:phytoene synthase
MAGAWEHLIADGALSREDMEAFARLRGGQFFRLAARALGGDSSPWIERAGEAWALADLARRSRDAGEAAAVLVSVRERAAVIRGWPAMLRPLGMLAMLAVRDAERGPDRLEPIGSPRRMMAMLRYRLIGR